MKEEITFTDLQNTLNRLKNSSGANAIRIELPHCDYVRCKKCGNFFRWEDHLNCNRCNEPLEFRKEYLRLE